MAIRDLRKKTPKTSAIPDLKPPETVRATIAIQTGPGVKNNSKSAPEYKINSLTLIVIAFPGL